LLVLTTNDSLAHDVRCACGRLLARRTAMGYELKCMRCKTLWRLPWDASQAIERLSLSADETKNSRNSWDLRPPPRVQP